MYQKIPKDKYKRVKIDDDIDVTGYKSMSYDYDFEKYPTGKIDYNRVNFVIETKGYRSSFTLSINGRDSLLKLKEALEFALEIEEE